jgi:hypothetical protein
MLIDKIVKNILAMQAPLYHINQLLFKAYNGKFPNAKATVMEFSVMPSKEDATKKLTKENVLKLFSAAI